jgi:hypothetical protein
MKREKTSFSLSSVLRGEGRGEGLTSKVNQRIQTTRT